MVQGMKIAITGGFGFIGSHLVNELSKNNTIVNIDSRQGKDITDLNMLKKEFEGVDYVFHLAALISVQESSGNSKKYFEINTLGTLNVLLAAKEKGVKKVIFPSSAAVYGNNPVPHKEDMLPDPLSLYAITKLDGEYLMKMFKKVHGLNTCAIRFFNVYGPRQEKGAISKFIRTALKNEDIIIYGRGEQTRDFVYVKDVIKTLIQSLEKDVDLINFGTGTSISIKELAEKIISLTNSSSKIVQKEGISGEVLKSEANISKAKALGFNPEYSLDQGLKETIESFK